MGVTLFSDGTNQYYRITKRWGDKDHQYYVRVGKNKERALKEALAIEARLDQAARAHAGVKDLTGENYIHHDGSIVGVALGFRQRAGRLPNIEFKVRVAATGKPVRFSTVSLNKYEFDDAFMIVIATVAKLRDIQKGSEAYLRLIGTKAYYVTQFAVMNEEMRGAAKGAKKDVTVKTLVKTDKAQKNTTQKKTKTPKATKVSSTLSAATTQKVAKNTTKVKEKARASIKAPKATNAPSKLAKQPSVAVAKSAKKVKQTEKHTAKTSESAAKNTVNLSEPPVHNSRTAIAKKAKRKTPVVTEKKLPKSAKANAEVISSELAEPTIPLTAAQAPIEIINPVAEEKQAAQATAINAERTKKAAADDWEEMLSREVQRFMQRKGIVRG